MSSKDTKYMDLDQFLNFFIENNITIINAIIISILAFTGLYIFFFLKPDKSEDAATSKNIKELETALKKIIEKSGGLAAVPAAKKSGDASSGGISAEVEKEIQEKIQAKDKAIEELQKQLETIKAEGGSSGEGGDTSALEKKIKELESKLAEYEIIEDDIANLSAYKEENERLKAQLGGAAPAEEPAKEEAPPAEAAAEEKVEEEKSEPTPAEEPAKEEAPSAEAAPEEDPVMQEFEAAVASVDPDTTAEEAPPAEAATEEKVEEEKSEPAPAEEPAKEEAPPAEAAAEEKVEEEKSETAPVEEPAKEEAPPAEAATEEKANGENHVLSEGLDTDKLMDEAQNLDSNAPSKDEEGKEKEESSTDVGAKLIDEFENFMDQKE